MRTKEWDIYYYYTTTLQRAETYLKIIKKLELNIHEEIYSDIIYSWLVSNAEMMQIELDYMGYGTIRTNCRNFGYTKLQLICYFEEYLSEKVKLDFIFRDLPYFIYSCKKTKSIIKPLKNLFFYIRNSFLMEIPT